MKTLMLIIATLWVTQTLADFRVTDPVFSPPHWTTATRPVCTAGGGCVGYNTDLAKLETWNGTAWVISGSGSSDLLGPVASATGTVAIYADDTGKLLSSTLYTIPTDPGNVGDVLRISSAGSPGGGTPTVVLGPQVAGQVQTDLTQLYDYSYPFILNGVLPGDIVTISSGTIQGDFTVVSVLGANILQLDGAIATQTNQTDIGYFINRGGAGSGTAGVAEWQAISSSKIVDADGNTSVDTDVTGTGNADTIIFSNNGIETARFVPGTAGTPTETPVISSGTGSTQSDLTHLYDFNGSPFSVVLPGDIVTISSGTIGDYTVVNVISVNELQVDGAISTGTFEPDSIVYSINRISGGGASGGSLGIGTDTPNPNAILDLSSDSKAFLLPRLTNSAMNAIPSPLNGMQVYNVDQKKVYFYNGSGWEPTGVASALFNLGITDASSIATPSNPPAPPTGYKNGDFYIVNGFGAVAPMFFPSVTTAGTGDYLIFDDGGDGIGGAAGDTWEKIAFSDVGQITRNGTTTDGNLMIWDQDNTNSAKDLGISALDLLTMGLNAPGPNFAVVSAGAGDKTTKLTPYTLPEDTGGVGYVLTTDGVGTATWVDIGTIAGSGNVVGPATSTDNSLALYDGATGKLIKSTPYTMPTVACADGEILSSDGTNFVCTPVGAVSKTVYNANGYAAVAGSGTPTETPIIASGTGATSATTTQLVDNTSPFSVVLPGDIVTISSSTLPGDRTVVSVIGANTLQLDGDIATQTFEQDIAYSINRMEAGGGTSTSGFYFSNVRVPTNSTCYTVTNNSTEGFYFTVNEKCVFTVSFTGSNISGLLDAGFVLNPTAGEAAGSFKDIPFGKKLCNTAVQGVTGSTGSCSFQWEGTVGEKIQLIGSAGMTPDTPEKFAVSILGFSPGSDIGISTAAVTPPTEVVVVSQRSTGGASPSARMVLFDNSAPFSGVLIGDTVKITAPAGGGTGTETIINAQRGGGQSGPYRGGSNILFEDSADIMSAQPGDIVRITACTNCFTGDFTILSTALPSTVTVNGNIFTGSGTASSTILAETFNGSLQSTTTELWDGNSPFDTVAIGDVVHISSSTVGAVDATVTNWFASNHIGVSTAIGALNEFDIGYSISRSGPGTNDITYSIVRPAAAASDTVVVAQRGGGYSGEGAGGPNHLYDNSFVFGSVLVGDIVKVTSCDLDCAIGDFVVLQLEGNGASLTVDGNIYNGVATATVVPDSFNGYVTGAGYQLQDSGTNIFIDVKLGDIVHVSSSTIPGDATVVALMSSNMISVDRNIAAPGETDIAYSITGPRTATGTTIVNYSIVRAATGTSDVVAGDYLVNAASPSSLTLDAPFFNGSSTVTNITYEVTRMVEGTGGGEGGGDVVGPVSSVLNTIAQFADTTGKLLKQTPYALPTTVGTSGQVLQSNGTNLVFATPSAGTGTSGNVVGDFFASGIVVSGYDLAGGAVNPSGGAFRFVAPNGSGGYGSLNLKLPLLTSGYDLTLPAVGPGTANRILQSDANGQFSWIDTPGAGTATGGVTGPVSSTVHGIASYASADGKTLESYPDISLVDNLGQWILSIGGPSGGGSLMLRSNQGSSLVLNVTTTGNYSLTFPGTPPATDQILVANDSSGGMRWVDLPGASTATGGGDVVGPASAFDKGVAFFDGTTGKLLAGQFGIGSATPFDSLTVGLNFDGSGGGQTPVLRMVNPNSNILSVKQSIGQNVNYEIIYPSTAPAANQVLETSDGSGQLYWIATPASDARLKKNISPMSRDFLADIMALTPSSFEWTEKTRPAGAQRGLIAQDVMKVIPEAVYAKPSGTLDLNDRALIATLIGAMKQQQAQIEALKLEIQELKK